MSKIGQIGENTLDDISDELVTGVTYKYANRLFDPLINSLKSKEESIFNEALQSGLNTLKFGITNAVIVSVSQYASTKLIQTSTLIFTYVKAGTLVKSLGKIKNNTVRKVGRVGGKLLKGVLGGILGTQEERLALSKMANDNVNNLASIVSQERQNQILMQGAKYKHLDNQFTNVYNAKKNDFNKKMNLFTAKFKTGSWNLNSDDKKLYEDCTGYKFSQQSEIWNKNFLDKLNSMSEFAKDVDGKIYNAVQVHLDYIATHGFQRVK